MKFERYLTKDFYPDLADSLYDWIKEQKATDFILTVEPVKSKRSHAQRKFLWGVLYPSFMEHAPNLDRKEMVYSEWSKDDWHATLTEKFLRVFNEKTKREQTRSTESLTLEEYSKYIEDCINTLVKLGGIVPDSEEYLIAQGLK